LGLKSLLDLGTLHKVSEEYPKILTNIAVTSWCSQFVTKPKPKSKSKLQKEKKEDKEKIRRRRSGKNFKVTWKNNKFTSNFNVA
jgi:hypothetical protein